MVSLLSIVVMALVLLGLLLFVLLPADFRAAFFRPATLGEQLLVRSLGIVAIATLIAEFTIGCKPDNGIYGISPCLLFGVYLSLVVYGRAAYFFWKRQSQKRKAPASAAQP